MKILKNKIVIASIILLVTAIVLYFALKDDFNSVVNCFLTMDLKYIFLAFIFFFLFIFFRAFVVYKTVNNKNKFSLKESYKHNLIVQFFNGVTPFSTGGQPMEIYMLSKHNITGAESSTIILQNFIFYQIALVLFGLLAVTYNFFFHIFPKVSLLRHLVLIGFFINTLVAIGLLFVIFSPVVTKSFIFGIIKVLNKLKLVKNKDKQIKKWNDILDDFHNSAKKLSGRRKLVIYGILFNFLGLVCYYIIPLFILFSLHNFQDLNVINTLVSSAYVMVMGAFVPIPGGSGGIEYGFSQFFGNFISGAELSTVLLMWRFITYYFGMILGGILLNFDKGSES